VSDQGGDLLHGAGRRLLIAPPADEGHTVGATVAPWHRGQAQLGHVQEVVETAAPWDEPGLAGQGGGQLGKRPGVTEGTQGLVGPATRHPEWRSGVAVQSQAGDADGGYTVEGVSDPGDQSLAIALAMDGLGGVPKQPGRRI
jgi:hypothetical protein